METAFKQIGKSYAVAAAEIGCSKPTLVGVIKHRNWPKKNAAALREKLKHEERKADAMANDYAKLHCCRFCAGSRLHSCTGYDCREPYQRAYEYAKAQFTNG